MPTDGPTITLPLAAVKGVVTADTPAARDQAILDLRRAYLVATVPQDAEDMGDWWQDLDPRELPRF